MSVTAGWWTNESPRAHVAKFYDQLRLIRSVLRASKFSALILTEIVILWVYYTIPLGFTLIWHFWSITLQFWRHFHWLRITDEGSVTELRIWSILIIETDLKWCVHLSRRLFTYFNYLLSVTAGGPRSPQGRTYLRSTIDFDWFVAFWEHQHFRVNTDWNYNFVGLLHHPFWLYLDLALLEHHFTILKLLSLAEDHWWGFSIRNAHMIHIVNWIRYKMVYTSE